MGNFDINLSDEDMKTLKGLAKDTAYTRLAGSYTAAAQADMLKGMGAGAAEHGLGGAGAIIAGIGLGQMMPGAPAPATAPPPPPAPGFAGGSAGFTAGPAAGATTCASCSTVIETLTSAVAIKSTLTPSRPKTSNMLAKKPLCSSMRVEVTVSTVIGPRVASAVTGRWLTTSRRIVVKRPCGRCVWRTVTGMLASTAG